MQGDYGSQHFHSRFPAYTPKARWNNFITALTSARLEHNCSDS
jgi:hypothetical protein